MAILKGQALKEAVAKRIAEKTAKEQADARRAKILEQAKARRAVTETKRPAIRKPIKETRKFVEPKRVINETKFNRNGASLSLTENVNSRLKKLSGLTETQKRNMTVLSENIFNHTKAITEMTQAGMGFHNVAGNQAGVGLVNTYFDIFYGYFPELIGTNLVSTQPIKTPTAIVFYHQVVAGSDKGQVKKGEVLMDAFSLNTDPEYTSSFVTINVGESTPKWAPVVPQSVEIEGFDITWTSDTAGTFGTDGVVAVTETDATISVALTGTDAAGITKVKYEYDNIYAPTEVAELDANVKEISITAKNRTLKTNFSFQAGYGYEQQFGKSLDKQLAEDAVNELKREIDLEIVRTALAAAPTTITWNKSAGQALGTYEFHKLSFLDAIITAANHISKISKRVRGNVLVLGMDALTIVESLPAFKAKGEYQGGAAVVGEIKGMLVIASPDIPDNEFLVAFKDKKKELNAGIIFAPYLPVYATQPVMLDDFVWRQAFAESHGLKVVNPNYFVRGRIVSDPMAQSVMLVGKDGTTYGVEGTDAIVGNAINFA